ncbi:hypothetical protein EON81_06125 [bacterium]|nr:MAG: hypothetical protein EON81_06125 [bacterium]
MATRTLTRKAARPRKPWVRRLKLFFAMFFMLMLVATIVTLAAGIWLRNSVKNEVGMLEDKLSSVDTKPSQILSADGKVIYEVSAQFYKPFKLADVPVHVRKAFLAAEDRRFYQHSGVDPIGLGRVVYEALKDRRASQGGSTLTMQLSKQLVTDVDGKDRSMDRKLKDIALSWEMESIKSKDQLLELYLKTCYFGEGAKGLAAASEVYFGKETSELTIGEAAMLARCVRRPGRENPVKDYKKAVQNRNVVLGIMKEDGMITLAEYEKAKAEKPKIVGRKTNTTAVTKQAGYFVDEVISRLHQDLPDIDLKVGGYRVETTIRMDLQRFAEKSVNRVVRDYRRARVSSGCFVMMNSSGEVLAMVGGTDYGKSQFNVVTQGMRQPGSSFKPFIYSAGLESGTVSPNENISNAPIEYPDPSSPGGVWRPQNSSRKENAPSYSLSTAISWSINRSAIHALEQTGIDVARRYARDAFGIQTPIPKNLTIALGTGEVHPIDMAEAYSVFMLRGSRVHPELITRVIGPDGRLVKEYIPTVIRDVLNYEVCERMDGYLHDVVFGPYGTAKRASSLEDAHGKTGTTSSHKDAWFCGYANGLVGISWVGNLSGKEMTSEVYGGTVSVKFWTDIMTKARDLGLGKKISVTAPKIYGADEIVPSSDTIRENVRSDREREEEDRRKAREEEEKPKVESEPADLPPSETFPTEVPPIETSPTPKDETTPTPVVTPPVEPRPQPVVKRDPPRRPRPASTGTVEVEICADTGQRASIYCPETVTRSFARGKAPSGRCKVHGGGG